MVPATIGWAKRLFLLGGALLASGAPAPGLTIDAARLIDLTHAFDAATVYWPTARSFTLEPVARGMTAGGYWYAANNFCAAEHGGTHLDAPIHFAAERWTADEVPLDRLIGPAVVVDLSEKAARDADALLTRAGLEALEAQDGRIPDGAIVLVRTDWDRWWEDLARYLGTATPGDTAHLHFPGVAPEAAAWLTTARRIRSIGIDTASIDHGPSRDFRAHRVLTNANVPIFENLAGLAALPPRGAVFIGLPMKIRGGSGGPLRAVALLP
jgi:kynurenine formamidase